MLNDYLKPLPFIVLLSGLALLSGAAGMASAAPPAAMSAAGSSCTGDNGGIVLSPGFCATVFADRIGHARHLVVAPNGVVYANTWSGTYYRHDTIPAGGFLVALQDTQGTGKADVIKRFGDGVAQGSAGGTGIALYNGALYVEVNDRIVRYALGANAIVPTGKPEVIVAGMPLGGDHPMHPFIIDAKGNLFVEMGSATNACEVENRIPKSSGNQPCTEKDIRSGIWRYDASKTGQQFSPKERYATGIRNGEGFAIDADGRLFVTQHGRDSLSENWADRYKPQDGPELPAEEVVQLQSGADYGWPKCYFDGFQKKLVLAPEYGGDGGKTVGLCAQRSGPAAFFPAHWAPNDLLIVTNSKFPAAYRKGAFIAFHGSWNRAPKPQGGYNVVFQPMTGGKASGDFVVFADGFAGAMKEPGRAVARPSGLAVGPDGSLYISDDQHGRIWRVTYHGDAGAAKVTAAPALKVAATSSSPELPPEGVHPDAGRQPASLTPPPGVTKDQVALGDRIFHGEVANGTCAGCHGSDGSGTGVGADLISGPWLWSDGSLAGITKTVTEGVRKPKTGAPMAPSGGAALKPDEVKAVAAYVYTISRQKTH